MENILYLAVFGRTLSKLPQNCGVVYGGFGFQKDGSLRIPYTPPEHAVIVFDDRVIPSKAVPETLQAFLKKQNISTVIFDFEQPKNSLLCELVRSIQKVETVLPAAYAGVRKSTVLVAPYFPKLPFSSYLQNARRTFGNVLLDLCPISCSVCSGIWERQEAVPKQSGRFSGANQCMYATRQTKKGTEIQFYDTQKSLLSRAAAAGLPCLLPYSEFDALEK